MLHRIYEFQVRTYNVRRSRKFPFWLDIYGRKQRRWVTHTCVHTCIRLAGWLAGYRQRHACPNAGPFSRNSLPPVTGRELAGRERFVPVPFLKIIVQCLDCMATLAGPTSHELIHPCHFPSSNRRCYIEWPHCDAGRHDLRKRAPLAALKARFRPACGLSLLPAMTGRFSDWR